MTSLLVNEDNIVAIATMRAVGFQHHFSVYPLWPLWSLLPRSVANSSYIIISETFSKPSSVFVANPAQRGWTSTTARGDNRSSFVHLTLVHNGTNFLQCLWYPWPYMSNIVMFYWGARYPQNPYSWAHLNSCLRLSVRVWKFVCLNHGLMRHWVLRALHPVPK